MQKSVHFVLPGLLCMLVTVGCSPFLLQKKYQEPTGSTPLLTFIAPGLKSKGAFKFNDRATVAIGDRANPSDIKYLGMVPLSPKKNSETIHVSVGHELGMSILGILGGTDIATCQLNFKFKPKSLFNYKLVLNFPVLMPDHKTACRISMWKMEKGSDYQRPVKLMPLND